MGRVDAWSTEIASHSLLPFQTTAAFGFFFLKWMRMILKVVSLILLWFLISVRMRKISEFTCRVQKQLHEKDGVFLFYASIFSQKSLPLCWLMISLLHCCCENPTGLHQDPGDTLRFEKSFFSHTRFLKETKKSKFGEKLESRIMSKVCQSSYLRFLPSPFFK